MSLLLPRIKTETSTVTTYTLKLGSTELIRMVEEVMGKGKVHIPLSACITIHIPSGGDWSGQDLEITDSCPVTVKWKEKIVGG